jgi:hypothetical protein
METQKKISKSKSNLEPKEQCWRYNSRLQTILQSHSNKAWYWPKNKRKEQWNEMKDPDTSPHSYSHFVFDKGT